MTIYEADVTTIASTDVIDPFDLKNRGGYYTPTIIARALADWAVTKNTCRVLEPSAGNGQVVSAIIESMGDEGDLTAIELCEEEALKAAKRGGERTNVFNEDFFSWYLRNRPDGCFDAVLGNPPFIRYQQFNECHRQCAFELMREEGLHPTRLTNAWLPFVVMATRALKQGGRLALVLPAELLQVKYAAELRVYLAAKYSQLTIVTFKRLVFPKVQQETILLFGIRGDGTSAEISLVEACGTEGLHDLWRGDRQVLKEDLDHAKEKWIQYYLTDYELSLVRDIEESGAFPKLGDLAEVDVGIVTGRNEFFVLTGEEAKARGVLEWTVPTVSRSAHIKGLVLKQSEWQRIADENGKCFLMQLGQVDRDELTIQALAYVEFGESQDFHNRYKCRIRLPRWWSVPSVWSPDAFLLRQIYEGPRIILNPENIVCTDTIHRIRMIGDVNGAQMAARSVNSLTYAFAELRGRSYGGGVLELEPSEAESLLFPTMTKDVDLDFLDWLARQGSTERVLDFVDKQVLEGGSLSGANVKTLKEIWHKLFTRRLRRKRV